MVKSMQLPIVRSPKAFTRKCIRAPEGRFGLYEDRKFRPPSPHPFGVPLRAYFRLFRTIYYLVRGQKRPVQGIRGFRFQ
jgi:hypothetical protein